MTKEEIKEYYDALLEANPHLTVGESIDWQIRQALENCILAVDDKAVVYPFDSLTHKPEDYANLFLSEGISNGWVIKRTDLQGETCRQNSYEVSFIYDVWGFRSFDPESRTNNSDLKFQNTTDLIFVLTANLPTLGIERGIERHNLLRFNGMDTLRGGDEQMHWNPGKIEVVLCEMQPGTGDC